MRFRSSEGSARRWHIEVEVGVDESGFSVVVRSCIVSFSRSSLCLWINMMVRAVGEGFAGMVGCLWTGSKLRSEEMK